MYDFIIIGGGITGLSLGALLSNDGHKILIIEKNEFLGGRTNVQQRNGCCLDYGIHIVRFGTESAIAQTCRKIGKEIEFGDIGNSYIFDNNGNKKLFPTKPFDILKSNLFSIREKFQIIFFIQKIKNINSEDYFYIPIEKWLNKNKIQGGLIKYFTLLSTSMAVSPYLCRISAGEILRNIQIVLKKKKSIAYPLKGWNEIYDLLITKIRENGEIITGQKVDKILIEDGKTKGVLIKNEIIHSKNIVCAFPVQYLFEILDSKYCPIDFVQTCKNLRPTAGISIDFILKKRISDIAGLIYIENPISYGMFISNLCNSLVPEGKQLLTIITPLSLEIMKDKKERDYYLSKIQENLNKIFPTMEENIEWKRILCLDMIDGVENNINQTTYERPSIKVPNIENLYLVGDSTNAPGLGGDIGHNSVHETYNKIIKDINVDSTQN